MGPSEELILFCFVFIKSSFSFPAPPPLVFFHPRPKLASGLLYLRTVCEPLYLAEKVFSRVCVLPYFSIAGLKQHDQSNLQKRI